MTATTRPATAAPAEVRSQGIALRRGIVLVLMSVVVPGSAQLAAGNKRVGRIAIRIWLCVIVLAVLAGVGLLLARGVVLGLGAHPITLTVLQFVLPALFIGWALLLVDAWRLANPAGMSTRGRVLSGVMTLALVAGTSTLAWSSSTALGGAVHLVDTVFEGGGSTQTTQGRYNVLLMGGDAGADRIGMRPDSMIVASIDADTGRTVLFSLPRNLQWAPIPQRNPLHAKYPNGFWCASQECLLNAVYTLAENNKKLFPGVKYPGAESTSDVVGEILGLDINYWAMIDLKGFEHLINAVGGIRLDISKRIPIGSLHGPKGVYDWIEPGKNVKLDGFHALWFARSREYSSDYERMQRQKCVINAMVKQLNPTTVVTKFTDIASASEKVVATNLPGDQFGAMLDLALKGRSLPMASVNFAPPLIKPVKPDFAKIKQIVGDKIAASEAKDAPAAPTVSTSTSASPSATSTKTSTGQADDLDAVCKVSD